MSKEVSSNSDKVPQAPSDPPAESHQQSPMSNTHKDTNNSTSGSGQQQPGDTTAPADDPTRYGDWVKNGRCIDF